MTWDFTRHVAVFNRAVATRQWGELVDLFDADAVMEFVGAPAPPVRGREAIAAAYAADGPDDTIELTGPVTHEGAEEVVPYRWQSTGRTGTMRATVDGDRLRRLVVTFDPDDGGTDPVLDWLLDSDPSIRWQVMRDLQDVPEPQWRRERARVETEGFGARLLALEDDDGQWAGGTFLPRDFEPSEWEEVGQPWTATTYALSQLRELGLDPTSESAVRAVRLVGENARWWDDDDYPFWGGETEECINGRVVADGAYFGVDMAPLVGRLLGEQMEDGGWNCERPNGSTRSSFATTINVLEGLLEHELATGGTEESRAARRAGEEFLLQRRLFRRLSTGAPADEAFLSFIHPNRWRYDVLRALDYFRAAAALGDGVPDPRLADAIDHVRAKQAPDGRWLLDDTPRGRTWFAVDGGVGLPSRWLTLRALRVLRWWAATQVSR